MDDLLKTKSPDHLPDEGKGPGLGLRDGLAGVQVRG